MPLTAERLYKVTEQYASELHKALTATSSSGAALQPEDLEPALVEELFRLQPLLALMPIKQATARVHEIARRTAHGKARFEGEMVSDVANAVQSTFDRPTVALKVLHHWGAVSGFQQAASRRFTDSLVAEQQGGIEAMSNQFEFGLLWGHTVDPYLFGGFDQFITTNINDHNAVVTLKLLDDIIDAATGFRGADRDPAIFIASKQMISKITGLQTLARINVDTVEFEGGLRMTTYRGYPLLETDYVKPSAQAPGNFAGSPAAGGSLTAGAYRYQIASVRENGEQRAATEITVTTATTNLIAALTWNEDADAILYKIYRSDAAGGAGTAYLLTTIAARNRDSSGKPTTAVVAFNDDGTVTRPAGAASERMLGAGDENIFFTNLNPDRGSSLVGLLNPLGQPVTNLVQFIPLATTRESFDFMLSSFAALQVPWENLHAHARRVRIT
jgi:hypothetical protein